MAKEPLSDKERKFMERILSFPLLFPTEFTGWIPKHVERAATSIPESAIASPPVDEWHYVGESGEAAFENSWVNYHATQRKVAYTKRDGWVHLAGVAKSGTVAQTIFTLPAAYYHDEGDDILVPVVSNALFGVLSIGTAGAVTLESGSNTYVSLYGIRFPAA